MSMTSGFVKKINKKIHSTTKVGEFLSKNILNVLEYKEYIRLFFKCSTILTLFLWQQISIPFSDNVGDKYQWSVFYH